MPRPNKSAPPNKSASNSLASDLADEFDDLQFLPPGRSSPPSMKNFIASASSESSASSGGSVFETESDDFTIGSRFNTSARSTGPSSGSTANQSHTHTHQSRRASHPSINYRHTNSKERYVFSKFLVKEGSNLPKSVDEAIDWLSIEMVLVPEIENILCPICLDVPCVPRFTRCGHIYCLPCLLQFFQTSEASAASLGNNWRTCPVCAEPLHLKQLRPVKFCPATEPKEGEIFNSVLIKKPIGALHPLQPSFPNDTLNTLSPFQRLIPISRSFLVEQILNPELIFLRSEIKKRRACGEETLELSFFESSVKQIEDIKTSGAASGSGNSLSTQSTPNTHSCHSTQSTPNTHSCHSTSNDLSTPRTPNVHTNIHNTSNTHNQQEFYYFHQSRDGLNIFLHPLCMKILKYHFESYESIPSELSLPILQLERVIVTSSNRKRFKYLDHLSLGTQIILVEVDLKSIVSSSTLQSHQKELSSRQGIRDQKLTTRDRGPRDRSILEEWKMMEDDYYSISQATAAMDIKVPESVKLDNLDDEDSFPLPSSFNNNSTGSIGIKAPAKKQMSSGSPSFSALAHSLNSPFTFNSSYSGDGKGSPVNVWNTPTATNEESPTLSILSTSSTSGKKKIVLFSTGLNLQKKT